jgi:hypothetical protein
LFLNLPLERAFQRLRLFPADGASASVEVRRGAVEYTVRVRADGEEMTQRRSDTGTERPVSRERPAAAGAVELPDCASVALRRATEHAARASEAALPALLEAVRRHGGRARTEADVRRTMEFFARAAALHMNIDPFKSIDGQPLLELYCDDAEGRYRTLFETGTGGGR